MNAQQAREVAEQVSGLILAGQPAAAYEVLSPVLAERTPFRLLDIIGEAVGFRPLPMVSPFMMQIAARKLEGGWVVIATALRQHLDHEPGVVFDLCRQYIAAAEIWYATDIFGERVPGPALVSDFEPALERLKSWREDPDRWIRRTVGVAAHYWTKRSRGMPALAGRAQTLMAFLEPMFEERDMDTVKGVGWALKTFGRYYPELSADWLADQVITKKRTPRALMLRKALKFLSEEQRNRAVRGHS